MARTYDWGNSLGMWVFVIGIAVAIIFGAIFPINYTWVIVYMIVGIAIGVLSLAVEDSQNFLFGGLAIVIAGALGQSPASVVPFFLRILQALLIIFVPATIVVAIRHLFIPMMR